jgi:hypothetical protein
MATALASKRWNVDVLACAVVGRARRLSAATVERRTKRAERRRAGETTGDIQVALLSGHGAWMVGRVVYRDVWWEHDAAGLRDPELAEIERALGVES